MIIEDALKMFSNLTKHNKVGQKFYPGNRVYFVDNSLIPHIGTVMRQIDKEYVMVNYITNTTDLTLIMTVPVNRCTKTAEIYLGRYGEPSTMDLYSNRSALDLRYEKMPKIKNGISLNPYKYFTVNETMYMLVSKTDDGEESLYKVKAKTFGSEIKFYLEDYLGYILFPIGVACDSPIDAGGATSRGKYSFVQESDFIVDEWLSMVNGNYVDFKTQIKCVYETDPLTRNTPNQEFNTKMMSPIWKNPLFK